MEKAAALDASFQVFIDQGSIEPNYMLIDPCAPTRHFHRQSAADNDGSIGRPARKQGGAAALAAHGDGDGRGGAARRGER